MGRMRSKTVSGALIPTETTVQYYDDVRRDANLVYYSNNGRLTTAIKTVPAMGAIAAVNVQHQMNYDVAGRLQSVANSHVSPKPLTLLCTWHIYCCTLFAMSHFGS
jgi:hypothetical protein